VKLVFYILPKNINWQEKRAILTTGNFLL